jgi:protein gp37
MLPAIRESMTIYEVEDRCQEVIEAAAHASLDEAIDHLQRLSAIEEYLAKRNLAGPVQTAERNLERRIGELLGPAETGRPKESLHASKVSEIEATARHRFRLIAEHWDDIEPKLPCTRAEALRVAEAARKAEEGQPPGMYTVEGWALAGEIEQAKALAYRGKGGVFNKQEQDNIEWARWSWNPVTGCLHNCPYCYARDIAKRLYAFGFEPIFHPSRLGIPAHMDVPKEAEEDLGWRNVFVCSMADLFGKWVPEEWIRAVLARVEENPQWNFLFLTKFPIRLAEFAFPDNAWVGTTVDCQARAANAEKSFRQVNAKVKWLSVEPMLEALHFADIGAFDWVVLGGASGSTQTPEWRPPRAWSEALRLQAEAAGCMVYEKTNLLERIRDYPGRVRGDARELPRSLAYIPSIGT